MSSIPPRRIRPLNDVPVRLDGDYVLYWMIAARRTRHNFALDRAIERARILAKPLVILEPLRVAYPHASDRFHRFILDGMAANQTALSPTPVSYYPYVEPAPGAGSGLLEALASKACLVVTDDYPCFFIPKMLDAAARHCPVHLEAVDTNGLIPIRLTERVYQRAVDFRRFLHDQLPGLLEDKPLADPLSTISLPPCAPFPSAILERWPQADAALLAGDPKALARLPIDHKVPVVKDRPGGQDAARRRLESFIEHDLGDYGSRSRDLLEPAHSRLSPYLHFGHISTHEILDAVFEHAGFTTASIHRKNRAKNQGFWGLEGPVESFLDELLTWREIGFNGATHMVDHTDYMSLPDWARQTLEEHEQDLREELYDLATLEAGQTTDPLWNAAQRELVLTGSIHSYLRMLWGKKILQWTQSAREALEVMIHLNDKYALDGRDPNSYSGIFWVLGRYDRPWGPERPIFGKVRYMTSDSTRNKLPVNAYLRRYGSS
jgi:deoxyribodipyrimidine photo-lyase